jgi:Flp pilus assembly protein TadG
MTHRHRPPRSRGATAAVEFALLLPVLVTLMVGLWEVGRIIQVQQVLSNAAREGARVGAQSQTINSTSAPTQIHVSTGSPNVTDVVVNYLKQANLNVTTADVTVEFAFISGDTTLTEPYQGVKGQIFRVTVRLPVSKVQWSALQLSGVTQLEATVYWSCLADDPFTLDTTLPSW